MRKLACTFAILSALSGGAAAQPAGGLTGGDGTFYVGAFPNRIYVIDEATEQVVDTIEMTLGGPPNDMRMSADGSRMYMRDRTFEHIEVIDLETRSTVDTFTLSEGSTQVRNPQHGGVARRRLRRPPRRHRHQARRPLRDRPPPAPPGGPRLARGHAGDPVAGRRGADRREHDVLARRRAALPVRRGDHRPRHRVVRGGRPVGAVVDRGAPTWSGSASASASTGTRSPATSRTSSACATRSRTGA